jgi:hypothetical protein
VPSLTGGVMATYGDKIRKYEARVRKAQELGLEPKKKDLKKLYYYVGRAEKKGADHETKLKDKAAWARKNLTKTAKELLSDAAKIWMVGG